MTDKSKLRISSNRTEALYCVNSVLRIKEKAIEIITIQLLCVIALMVDIQITGISFRL